MNMYDASGRPRVDHTYRDFSRYLEEGGAVAKHKKSGENFPAKLQKMLSDPRFSNIITWMPHGRAWIILDRELLVTVAVPEYFVQTKFESFTRQLSGWGFKRLHQRGPDFGCYYNESFLCGIPLLTGLMRRVNTKQGKLVPFPEGEPDFYLISRLHPLHPPVASVESILTPSAAGSIAPYVKPTSQSVQSETMRTDRSCSSTFAAASMSPSASMPHIHSNEMTSSAANTMVPSPSALFRPIVQNPAKSSGQDSLTSSSASTTEAEATFAQKMTYPPSYQKTNMTNVQNLIMPPVVHNSSSRTRLAETTLTVASTAVNYEQHPYQSPYIVQSSNCSRYGYEDTHVYSNQINQAYSTYPPNSYSPSPYAPNFAIAAYYNNPQHYGAGYDQYSTQPHPHQPAYSQQESISAGQQENEDHAQDSYQGENEFMNGFGF